MQRIVNCGLNLVLPKLKELKNLLGNNYKIIEVHALKDAYAD